ncbi:hypothetical protein HDK77DRAFT_127541 [Phyllosticta capitalensis]|uniref:Uncharacterized protein n=1 Tax=Phyllosticta capitalensis TaxID=121624 RepID=A0ABR1Z244_9PEZI
MQGPIIFRLNPSLSRVSALRLGRCAAAMRRVRVRCAWLNSPSVCLPSVFLPLSALSFEMTAFLVASVGRLSAKRDICTRLTLPTCFTATPRRAARCPTHVGVCTHARMHANLIVDCEAKSHCLSVMSTCYLALQQAKHLSVRFVASSQAVPPQHTAPRRAVPDRASELACAYAPCLSAGQVRAGYRSMS